MSELPNKGTFSHNICDSHLLSSLLVTETLSEERLSESSTVPFSLTRDMQIYKWARFTAPFFIPFSLQALLSVP